MALNSEEHKASSVPLLTPDLEVDRPFGSQQLLFLFSKHLDTMSNVTDCDPGQTDLCDL